MFGAFPDGCDLPQESDWKPQNISASTANQRTCYLAEQHKRSPDVTGGSQAVDIVGIGQTRRYTVDNRVTIATGSPKSGSRPYRADIVDRNLVWPTLQPSAPPLPESSPGAEITAGDRVYFFVPFEVTDGKQEFNISRQYCVAPSPLCHREGSVDGYFRSACDGSRSKSSSISPPPTYDDIGTWPSINQDGIIVNCFTTSVENFER